jgi:hypothetical protein
LSISESGNCQVGSPPDGGGVELHHIEAVAAEAWDLQVRRERRHHQGDAVAGAEEQVGRQRVEHVTDRRGTALDREEVPVARRRRALEQLVRQVLAQDPLDEATDAVGPGIVVADDAVDELVHEGVGVEPERRAVLQCPAEQCGTVGVVVVGQERREPRRHPGRRGHASEIGLLPDPA